MAEQTIIVHIQGYWRDQNRQNMLDHSGLFFVYEANFNSLDQTVDLLSLLFIGGAENIRERVKNHELYNLWLSQIRSGHELCYALAEVDDKQRERTKAAYIFAHNPPANQDYRHFFAFDTTTLISTGKTALLKPVITVKRSVNPLHETSTYLTRPEVIPVRSASLRYSHEPVRRLAFGE